MEIRESELKKLKRMGTSHILLHNEPCTKWQISLASGDPKHFSRGDFFERLLNAGVFIKHDKKTYIFNRKRLYDICGKLELGGQHITLVMKTPLHW